MTAWDQTEHDGFADTYETETGGGCLAYQADCPCGDCDAYVLITPPDWDLSRLPADDNSEPVVIGLNESWFGNDGSTYDAPDLYEARRIAYGFFRSVHGGK